MVQRFIATKPSAATEEAMAVRHILIGGGSGFIGRATTTALRKRGDRVTWISRQPGSDRVTWEQLAQEQA